MVQNPDGTQSEVDRSDELIQQLRQNAIDALIAIGGDGSLTIAHQLHNKGLWVVGVPKTIDNDLESTTLTFGFNSAVSFATECIDRLHSTALSHQRILVVEVMGRYAGWIAGRNCPQGAYSPLRNEVVCSPRLVARLGHVG